MGVFLPGEGETPVPVFLGISFSRLDQIFVAEGAIAVPPSPTAEPSVPNDPISLPVGEEPASQWPLATILARGYGVIVLNNREIAIDLPTAFDRTIYPLFYEGEQAQPELRQWGAISAWAWGLSRIMDVVEADPEIDASRVATIGHSRYGKTALWAAAQDERFAMAISNNSGCAGAALFRRAYGENIAEINRVFPHWFNDHFTSYDHRDQEIPLDQHQLLALLAPRPLYVASAAGDVWADPRGEYLSTFHASPAYGLYGFPVWETEASPEVGSKRWLGPIGYHLRPGIHDLTPYDWKRYLDAADEWL
ncbi:MAG: acetylxylan esterase [Bacteroidota bacterium]